MKRSALRRRSGLRRTGPPARRARLRNRGRASKRRADQSGMSDREWAAAVKERDRYQCAAHIANVCEQDRFGFRPAVLHAHHLKPRSAGGANTLANGISTCWPCHLFIHSQPAWARAQNPPLLHHSWDGDDE